MDDNISMESLSGASFDDAPETTDFGFKSVAKSAKKALVRGVFDSVASRYDLMNDAMSLGIHRAWKRAFVAGLRPREHLSLLDLAGGTGDITFRWLNAGGGPALMTDINAAMLRCGQERAATRGVIADIRFCVVDAEYIPLPDNSIDRVSIAFGLRNCTDKAAVLREALRVLRPGGCFSCLEFSKLQIAPLLPVYDAWSFKILPKMGQLIAKDSQSYQYLAESIRTFPDQETLATMFRDAGFAHVSYENLSGGIVAIHTGWRL